MLNELDTALLIELLMLNHPKTDWNYHWKTTQQTKKSALYRHYPTDLTMSVQG